ncbi:3-oxo-5-alpha-steroid 4-dehydrogenase 1-like protein [Aphelenchoides avenae]|nr:3-oxo-5-alpha-steroid 4-dehydrogenase 1-like protein [Aphelenchus avenae]
MVLEEEFILLLARLMIVGGVFVAFVLLFGGIRIPYGRYYRESWLANWSVSANLAWFIQESPALIFAGYYLYELSVSPEGIKAGNSSVLLLFAFHYVYRTLIHSYCIRGGKPTPIHMLVAAFGYLVWEGYMICAYHAKYATYAPDHFVRPASLLGLLLFFFGWAMHVHSDSILRNLRAPGESGYKIPRGSMFEYVSTPNYLGEITMWTGFALYANSLPAAALAFHTLANLGPRSLQHHEWYLKKFEDYPKERQALVPFLL